jgi:hypothetical protein
MTQHALSTPNKARIFGPMSMLLLQAAELQRRLEAELPRQQLDLRHRLDKDGQRYGKIINWK